MRMISWWSVRVVFSLVLLAGTMSYAQDTQSLSHSCASGHRLTLELPGGELSVFKPVTARLKIVDSQGVPVAGALVYCSLYMPTQATGTNRPSLKPGNTAGVYEGILLFSQSGDWRAALTLNLPGGVYEEVEIAIDGVAAVKN